MKLKNFFRNITLQEQMDFAKNLSVLLKGGVSINDAVDSLANQTRPGEMKKILLRIKGRLEKGVSLNTAITEEGEVFGKVVASLIRAGEMSGSLANNLDFVAEWLNREYSLKKEINSVLLYPKIVLSATVLLGGGLAIFILPKLVPMFTGLHVELPLITKIVLNISLFMQHYWLLIIAILFFAWLFYYLLFRITAVKYQYHRSLVHIPYIKLLTVGYQLALFSQLIGTLLRSGITIDEALSIAYDGATNLYYKRALKEIMARVSKGISLVETMKAYPELYPVNSTSVLSVGENTGTLEESFFKVSDFWSKEITNETKNLPTIIEPILLVFIGVAVGLIALSIIMPIYKLTGNLGV